MPSLIPPSSEVLTIDHLLSILEKKLCKNPHSHGLIEMILLTMSLNSQYGENVKKHIQNKKLDIKNNQHEKLDTMIREMWRSIQVSRRRPSMDGQLQNIYEFGECQKIEEKL